MHIGVLPKVYLAPYECLVAVDARRGYQIFWGWESRQL